MAPISSNKLDILLSEIKLGKVIDDQLGTTSKSGLYWTCLKVIGLIVCIFRIDTFSHYRADRVANALFNYCIKAELGDHPEELKKVIEILNILYTKKKGNKENIDHLKKQLNLAANVASKCENQKYLTSDDKVTLTSEVFKKIQGAIFSYSHVLSFQEEYHKEKPCVYAFLSKNQTGLPVDLRMYFNRVELDFANIFLELGSADMKGRLSFDLVTGNYFQHLDISQLEVDSLQDVLEQIIPKAVHLADNRANGAVRDDYTLYLEEYTGTLASLINPQTALQLEQKIVIIDQLITALKLLHQKGHVHLNIRMDQIVYEKQPEGEYKVRFQSLKSQHKIEDQIASKSDHPDLFIFQSMLEQFSSERSKQSSIKMFKKNQMMKMDLWNLGLVISSILLDECRVVKSNLGERIVPPLESIISVMDKIKKRTQLDPDEIQGEFNRECKEKQDASDHETVKNLWRLVSRMLQLEYSNRINASAAYDQFQAIKSSYKTFSQD